MTFRLPGVTPPIFSAASLGHQAQFRRCYDQGEQEANAGHYASALGWFEAATKIAPTEPAAWLYQAVCLIHLGQPQAALAMADQLLSYAPDCAQGWLFRGVALHRLGRYKAAYASYDKAEALSAKSLLGGSEFSAGHAEQ
ncbi:MAG: tetratricopeptide repeat protein [Leptolyngbyaceae cyanobacterium SM2_5_2]|nr:tetratricopeptide repeat protein [Leptolyngbyaceae cyanobacterium SM2_5_2]